MNPHIVLQRKPINGKVNYNDPSYDENTSELFHVVIAENHMKLLATVEWKDPNKNKREFQTVRVDHLYLNGLDKDAPYPPEVMNGLLSSDPSIVYSLFANTLQPYGIRLDKVVVHGFDFIESVNFYLADVEKKEQLYDLIDQACRKQIINPH